MTTVLIENDRVKLTQDDNGIAHLSLNRPEKRNAVDFPMIDAILSGIELLNKSTTVRCLILSGEGKAFCAGIDLAAIQNTHEVDFDLMARTHGPANKFQALALELKRLAVPVIAAIQGICFGAGMQLAGGADIRIATEDTKLAIRELYWGLVPDMAGYAIWRGIIRNDHLRELTYSARTVEGKEAQQLGLVTMLAVDPLSKAMEMAEEICLKNPDAIVAAKALFELNFESPIEHILLEESRLQGDLIGKPNQIEAMKSKLEKRKPNYS